MFEYVCTCYVFVCNFAAVVMDDQNYVVVPRVPGEQEGNAAHGAMYSRLRVFSLQYVHVFTTQLVDLDKQKEKCQ